MSVSGRCRHLESATDAFSWQWYRNGQPIQGATDSTYDLTAQGLLGLLQVGVTASKDGHAKATRLLASPAYPGGHHGRAPTHHFRNRDCWGNTHIFLSGWGSGTASPHPAVVRRRHRNQGRHRDHLEADCRSCGQGDHRGGDRFEGRLHPRHDDERRDGEGRHRGPDRTGPDDHRHPEVGNTLTAVPGTWSPTGVALSYQWFRDGSPIDDATESTHILQSPDLGRSVTVAVTGSKPGYTTESRTSLPTDSVAPGTLTDKVPTITGTPTVGKTLTAVPGTWGPAGVDLSYQWAVDGIEKSTMGLPKHSPWPWNRPTPERRSPWR